MKDMWEEMWKSTLLNFYASTLEARIMIARDVICECGEPDCSDNLTIAVIRYLDGDDDREKLLIISPQLNWEKVEKALAYLKNGGNYRIVNPDDDEQYARIVMIMIVHGLRSHA